MAADKNLLKSWFETGDIPTQAQFWAWIDAYWHKDEKIPITAIEEIESILDVKADAEAFQNHLEDENAHAELFAKTRIIPFGLFQIYKNPENSIMDELEPYDVAAGFFADGSFMPFGKYMGGDTSDPGNWDTSLMWGPEEEE